VVVAAAVVTAVVEAAAVVTAVVEAAAVVTAAVVAAALMPLALVVQPAPALELAAPAPEAGEAAAKAAEAVAVAAEVATEVVEAAEAAGVGGAVVGGAMTVPAGYGPHAGGFGLAPGSFKATATRRLHVPAVAPPSGANRGESHSPRVSKPGSYTARSVSAPMGEDCSSSSPHWPHDR
jgi:hypothetical protein